MAERRPIVLVSGGLQELPSGDTLPGATGGAVNTAEYRYATGGGVPTSGTFTMNSDLMTAVTTINVHKFNFAGNDIGPLLSVLLKAGSEIFLQKSNDTISGDYTLDVDAVDNTTYFTLTVTLVTGSGTLTNNNDVFFTKLSSVTASILNNYAATAVPAVTDDSGAGYVVGSQWIDVTNDNSYICADASVGAAVWLQTNTGTAGANGKTILNGAVDPTTEGVDGDFYINTVSNTIFGPKATTWPAGVSLIGPAGAEGNVDAFYAAALTTDLGTTLSTSTSAYATKGNRLVVNTPGRVESVTFDIEAGGVGAAYEIVIAKMSDMTTAATLSDVYKQAITPAAANETHTLTTPFSVITGDILFFGLTKTDIAAAADPLIRFFNTNTDNTIAPLLTYNGGSRGVRFTDNDIQNGDSPFDLTTSWWAVNIGFQPINGLLPAGGTAGQIPSKINGTDYNAEWVDAPNPNITLGTTITASRDLTNADLAGGVFLDVGHATVPIVINIPLGLTGTEPVTFQQTDVADVTFTVAGGGTIKSLDSYVKIAGDGGSVTLVPKGSNVYGLIGALIA